MRRSRARPRLRARTATFGDDRLRRLDADRTGRQLDAHGLADQALDLGHRIGVVVHRRRLGRALLRRVERLARRRLHVEADAGRNRKAVALGAAAARRSPASAGSGVLAGRGAAEAIGAIAGLAAGLPPADHRRTTCAAGAARSTWARRRARLEPAQARLGPCRPRSARRSDRLPARDDAGAAAAAAGSDAAARRMPADSGRSRNRS